MKKSLPQGGTLNPVLFSGRSHPELGSQRTVALGHEPDRIQAEDFAHDELRVEMKQDVASCDLFLLRSTGAPSAGTFTTCLSPTPAARAAPGAYRQSLPAYSVAAEGAGPLPIERCTLAQLLADLLGGAGSQRR